MFKIKWHKSLLRGFNSCIIKLSSSKLNSEDIDADLENFKRDVNIAYQKLVQNKK